MVRKRKVEEEWLKLFIQSRYKLIITVWWVMEYGWRRGVYLIGNLFLMTCCDIILQKWWFVTNLQNWISCARANFFTVFFTWFSWRWEQISSRVGGRWKWDRFTYNSLGYSDIVGWCGCGWLIRSSSITQNCELLWTFNSTLSQTSKLNPVSANWLIGCDNKVVTFTYEIES